MDENYEVMELMDNYTERLIVGNKKLAQISEWIENAKTDEERQKYLTIFAAVYKEVAADARNADDATLRTSSIELENAKLEEENRSNVEKERGSDLDRKILIGTTAAGLLTQLFMFWRSSRKEKDEAYLTTTDRTVVQESLTGRFWNKLPFGKK